MVLVVLLDFFVEGGKPLDFSQDFDVFEHGRTENVIHSDVLEEQSHAVVEVPAFYYLLVQLAKVDLLENPT